MSQIIRLLIIQIFCKLNHTLLEHNFICETVTGDNKLFTDIFTFYIFTNQRDLIRMSYVVQQFKYYVSYVFNGNDDDMCANITLNISHENGDCR